jgi:hypothetical protein
MALLRDSVNVRVISAAFPTSPSLPRSPAYRRYVRLNRRRLKGLEGEDERTTSLCVLHG